MFGEKGQPIQKMISAAEKKMYQEKQKYYSQTGHDRKNDSACYCNFV